VSGTPPVAGPDWPVHPAATLFPLLADDELRELAEDIRRYGLREPVTLWRGQLLDGRNRVRACALAGVPPASVEWDGPDPVAWVVSKTLRRRHLDASQRAMLAARLRALPDTAPSGRTAEAAGRMLGVSRRSVEHASRVLAGGDPRLADAVSGGSCSVSVAGAAAGLGMKARDALVEAMLAATDPMEARRLARKLVDRERADAREGRQARRFARMSALAPAAEGGPAIDLRLADVTEIVHEVRGAGLVHADPAWRYGNQRLNGTTDRHYPTHDAATVAAVLDAAYDAAVDDSYMLVWCTFPLLAEWFQVSGHLRWEYKSGGAWGKEGRLGVGFHWRGDVEPLLLYVKGRPRPWGDLIRNFHSGPRGEHSEKPAAWLASLVRAFAQPNAPVLDLYAGLGSMALACAEVGRDYVGAELVPSRWHAARARLGLVG
jgi:ParB-like chromosome segregation protein Spo0J